MNSRMFLDELRWPLTRSIHCQPRGYTRTEIDQMLPKATAYCPNPTTIKVVPYADFNTIGKPFTV